MMEFWPENQGHSHLYSKFGTVPGRNCTHNYHDRHQASHYPLYYEQQDQGREASYWTVPGSRTGGALHEYTNWTDPELTVPSSSSHFPFILDRHTHHHQDLGEYQPHEAREWATAHRPARDYERGFLREGWQRRWEPCSPVRYNREVSAKRSDSSYRELEAWAARYSHSLPRRRRIEAELRGASQGLGESSRASERDSRSGTDPQVAALQHVPQSANSRESGLWDRGTRQQALTYYPSQAPAPGTSHMHDMKENTGYHSRMFSQPPGYIAPPPYNSPHKSSPVMHHCDTSSEQDGKRQAYWSQPTLRKQEVSADSQDNRKGKKEEVPKPDESKTCRELEGLKHQRQEADALQAGSPMSDQNTHKQRECMLSLQHPQEVQNSKIIKETSSKVIEGRKFRLNKKTGGMTIFCLVSRIAGSTETPSLPLCASKANTQSREIGEVSRGLSGEVSKIHKLADEVDFTAPTLTGQSDTSDMRNLTAKQKETSTCTEKEIPTGNLPNKAEADVSPEKSNINDVDSTFGRQIGLSVQPVSVKYPLWREPSFTSRAETESPSTCCLNVNTEESDSVQNYQDCINISSHPIDIEVRRLDIKEDTGDSKGLLVIDTTCVVVKMELIQSPKKEHVHYLGSTAHTEDSPFDSQTVSSELNCELNQDVTTDQNPEAAPFQMNEIPETDLDSTLLEKEEGGSEISFPCMPSSPVSERETLEERAERILGIPLHDCIAEQQPKDGTSFLDSCAEEQDEEAEPSPIKNDIHDANNQTPEDTTEEEQSQNHLEVVQIEDAADCDDARGQVTSEDGEDFVGSQEQVSDMTDSPLDIKTSAETDMTQDPLVESPCEIGTSEKGEEENQPVEEDQSSPDLNDSPLLSPDLTCPSYISESNTEEGPDPELAALHTAANLAPHPETSSLPESPLHQLPSPLPPGSTDSSPSPHTHRCSSSPPPFDFIDQTARAMSGTEDEEGETSNLTENEVNNESPATDITEEMVSQQQLEGGQAAHVTDEQQRKEADEEPARALEEKLETSEEKALDVTVLQQQLECVQTEGVAYVKESNITEEQPTNDISEDPAGLSVLTPEGNASDYQTEVMIYQQQLDYGQEEEALCVKESYMDEDQFQNNPDELPAGLWEQATFKNNASDSQTQIEIENWQDTEPQTEPSHSSPPSVSDCEASQSPLAELLVSEFPSPPHESDTDSACPSPLNPDTAASIPETVLPPLYLDSCEENLPCSSSSLSDFLPVLPPSSTPPPQEESVSPDFSPFAAHKAEPQYPKSLWDVVNRIRKHTAPDSENEEEEVSELWDPENLVEDLGCPNVVMDITSENIAFDEAEQQEVSKDSVEMGKTQQVHKEPSGHADEDTMSCSSNSSHGSGDTVIVADEDEVEETTPDAVTESTTENENEEFNIAEGDPCCSGEVKDDTVQNEEEEQGEADTNKSCKSEECPVEVESATTGAVEMIAVVSDEVKG